MPHTATARFAPLVFRLAARLDRLTWEEFTGDPAAMAQALRSAQAAFGTHALVSWFDPWAEAEHLGLVGDRADDGCAAPTGEVLTAVVGTANRLADELLPRLAAMTSRLAAERDAGTSVIAMVTGPSTLAERLWCADAGTAVATRALDEAGRWCVTQARGHFDAGADVVLVAEESTRAAVGDPSRWTAATAPVCKLAGFYRRACGVLAPAGFGASAQPFADALGLSAVGDPVQLLAGGGSAPASPWNVLDTDVLLAPDDVWDRELAAVTASMRPGIHTTSWEVPVDVEPERVARLGSAFRPSTTGVEA